MGLGARWHEIAHTYAEVNFAFGDIVRVTPTSKGVGDLRIFLVSHNMTVRELERLGPDHNLTLPNSVVEMFSGSLGEPEGGWPERIAEVVLKGKKPQGGRPGDHLAPVDLTATEAAFEKKAGDKLTSTDGLSYLMYSPVFVKCSRGRTACGC